MVRVKEAVQKAQGYLPEVFEGAEGRDLVLEGVELTEDAKFWTVTFSYGPVFERDFKTVKLRADDGEFVGARNGLASTGLL